ncbi:hypothetical protein [Pseudomonas piscis]
MTIEEEFEQHREHQKGINSATVAILQMLVSDFAHRIPPEKLSGLSQIISLHRHNGCTTALSPMAGEAYNRVFDAVEGTFIEVQEARLRPD